MKIRKPMRLEESLIMKVEQQGKGDTFTSKMEYILDDYFNSLDRKQVELRVVEEKIKVKEKEYKDFLKKVNTAKRKFDDVVRGILYS